MNAYEILDTLNKIETTNFPKSSFFYSKILTSETDKFFLYQNNGFFVVDCNIKLTKDFTSNLKHQNLIQNVRWSNRNDEPVVRSIARQSFKQNRFHRDPLIRSEIADSIKEHWAENYFTGLRGDWMVVYEEDDEVVGFLQLIKDKNEYLLIDLIAVLPKFSGRGVAVKMIEFAIANCGKGFKGVSVGTSAGNETSLKLYQKLEFRIVSSKYVLHRHT